MAQAQARFSVNRDVGLHNTDLLEQALDSMPGVTSVNIDKNDCCILVGFNNGSVSQEAIQAKIEILGYPLEQA